MDDEIDNNSHSHKHTRTHAHRWIAIVIIILLFILFFFLRYYFQLKHMKLLIMYGHGSSENRVCVRARGTHNEMMCL